MRKMHNIYNKENRYDQLTNLAIDLEDQINKSVVLPKISQKNYELELREQINRRKMQGDLAISHLQGEVDKLRRQVLMLSDKRHLWHQLRTQESEQNELQVSHIRSRHMISHHFAQTEESRLSVDDGNVRLQRNTDKRPSRLRVNESQIRQQLPSQVDLSNSKSTKISKEKRQSKQFFHSNKRLLNEKQKIKRKRHSSNPHLRRKFRKCVIAVYFAILVPSLARRIYKNKLKAFISQYPHQISKYYLNRKENAVSRFKYDEAKCWSLMEQTMDLMLAVEQANLASCLKDAREQREVRVHFEFLINEELSSQQREVNDYLSYEQQLMFPNNVAYLLKNLAQISGKMFDNFSELLQSSTFFRTQWKTFAQNILNNSFVNNSRPKLLNRALESGVAKMHQTKEVVLVASKEAEIALLTFDVFCRLYCYRWLYKLHKDKLSKQYTQENAIIGNFLFTFIYLVGETLLDETIKTVVKTNRTLPDRQKNTHRKIRPILPLSVKKKYKGLSTDTRRLIIDAPFFEEVSSIVLQYSDIVQRIKEQMLQAGTQLHRVLQEAMKADALQVKRRTVSEHYILRQDKNRTQNLLVYEPADSHRAEAAHGNHQKYISHISNTQDKKSTISIMVKKPKMNIL